MIVLTVVSYNGAATPALSASFDELGGSIGRADGNQLVLPDPERSISRQHARVVFRSGSYAIVDNGSNPIAVNGQPVPLGREQALAIGDTVQIGGYALAVAAGGSAAAASDPFADLFGDGAQGLAAPAPAAQAASPFMPAAAMAPAAPGRAADPWATPVPWNAAATAPAAAAAPPWSAAPAPAWAASPPPPPPSAPAAATSPAAGIPDDWDFLAPAPAPAASLATPQPAAGALPIAAPGLDSLDDLFGLAGGAPVADPLAAPQARALLQGDAATRADALQGWAGGAAPAAPASASDHASELHTPMPLPAPAAPVAPTAPTAPRGAIFSWDNPPPDGRVVTLPGMPSPNQPLAGTAAAPSDVPHTLIRPVPIAAAPRPAPATMAAMPAMPATPVAAQAVPPAAAPMAGAGEQVLLAALLQGLATPGLRIDQLTPELMQRLGELLRESTRGAVELLAARAALKREMRAMMTMIQGRENNPLKFSPTADAALLHLMGPAVAGFMAPAPAMRDAFDDLRAHQLGLMAGMKAALEGMLQRFDPQQLEGRIAGRAGLAGLIPATRKARLWEAFQQLFGQLSAEAQDDVDALFGKAFLHAYQDQLDRLQAEPTAPR